MNIALLHFRVGETDGVSLEMDKWKLILEKMGHTTYYIAGSKGTSEAIIIPELYYRDEYDKILNKECYSRLNQFTEEELKQAIIERAESIENQLVNIIKAYNIDLIVPNNLLCIGRSIHVAMGVTHAVEKTGIKVVNHHHDFYWERKAFLHPTIDFVKQLLNLYVPPLTFGEQMKHTVINQPAKKDLKEKKGLEATIVPNVFGFKAPLWVEDDYNCDFKSALGVNENNIVFLQATRVTNRKAIELAIDLIATLNKTELKSKMFGKTLYDGRMFTEDTEYILALIGLHEGSGGYEESLIAYAKEKGIHMIVNPNLVNHSRHVSESEDKIYALWDAYVYCDIITYPSIYEGWGNQFLEGLFAKKPLIVFEYSVFESDIKDVGFNYISLGNQYRVKENGLAEIEEEVLNGAALETMDILTNPNLYYKSVEENFELGAKHFSMEALESILTKLF